MRAVRSLITVIKRLKDTKTRKKAAPVRKASAKKTTAKKSVARKALARRKRRR